MTQFTKTKHRTQRAYSSKFQAILTLIAHKTNRQPKLVGRGYSIHCPAHEDKNPSLSISEGNDGRVLLYCHSGCPLEAICDSVGIKKRDLFSDKK